MKRIKIPHSLSLIVPAHNAAGVIAESMKEYLSFLTHYKSSELIIVCNGCTDDTAAKARAAARGKRTVKILEIPERGKGIALATGFRQARSEFIGFLDADNAFKLSSVLDMTTHLTEYDCVIASKWLGRHFFQVSEPTTRKMFAFGWRSLALLFFGLRFQDTQAGCKFLTRKAFRAIDTQFICTGFDFDVELLFLLKKNKFSIKEFNIPVARSFKFSTFRIKFIPLMFWNIFKLRVHSL